MRRHGPKIDFGSGQLERFVTPCSLGGEEE